MSINFIGSLPESLTQGLLVGKLLVGGLGVRGSPEDQVIFGSSDLRPPLVPQFSLVELT